jgi:hypothetical protein
MGIRERAAKRKLRIVAYRAQSFQDAEAWDLAFWQSQTPQQRLSALVAIRKDIAKVRKARRPFGMNVFED